MPFGWTVNPFRGCELGCRVLLRAAHARVPGARRPRGVRGAHLRQGGRHRPPAERPDPGARRRAGDRHRHRHRSLPAGGSALRGDPRRARGRWRGCPGSASGSPPSPPASCATASSLGRIAPASDAAVNVSLISLDAPLLRQIEPRAPRPDLRLDAMRALTADGRARAPLPHAGTAAAHGRRGGPARAAGRGPRGGRARGDLAGALPAYRDDVALLPRLRAAGVPVGARALPRALSRARQRAARATAKRSSAGWRGSAAEVGFPARTRDDRVRAEAPARPRQLSLVW